MVNLRRIGVRSAGRVGFWLGVAMSTTQLLIFLVFFLVIIGGSPTVLGGEFWSRVIISIGVSGFASAFSAGMFAFIYNMNTRIFGGLQLEFEDVDTPPAEEKRKRRVEIGSDDGDSDE